MTHPLSLEEQNSVSQAIMSTEEGVFLINKTPHNGANVTTFNGSLKNEPQFYLSFRSTAVSLGRVNPILS